MSDSHLVVSPLLQSSISTFDHPIQHHLSWSSPYPTPPIYPSLAVPSSGYPLNVYPINFPCLFIVCIRNPTIACTSSFIISSVRLILFLNFCAHILSKTFSLIS